MNAETASGRPSRYAGHGGEIADGLSAVLEHYDRLHAESRALFAALTDAQFQGKCLTPAGASLTTWKWLRRMLEHEAHHRGQLYLMLGVRGVAVPQPYGLTEGELVALSPA